MSWFRLKRLSPKTSSDSNSGDVTANPNPPTPNNPRTSLCAESTMEIYEQNQKLSIKNLPPEVFEVVFGEDAGFCWGHHGRLFRLRNVCRYWTEVIDSTPGLWRPIRSILYPELQAMIMRNSKKQPPLVEYDERIWERVPMGEERWKHLNLAWSQLLLGDRNWITVRSGRKVTNGSYPSLSITSDIYDSTEIIGRNKDTMDTPKLSHLSVCCWSLNWQAFSGLQKLFLDSTNPTLNELMAMLQGSPGLRFLGLDKTWLPVKTEGIPIINKIFLLRLHYLRILRSSAQSLSMLLDSIEAPSLSYFIVEQRYKSNPEDRTALCESAGRYIGAFPLPSPKDEEQARISIAV